MGVSEHRGVFPSKIIHLFIGFPIIYKPSILGETPSNFWKHRDFGSCWHFGVGGSIYPPMCFADGDAKKNVMEMRLRLRYRSFFFAKFSNYSFAKEWWLASKHIPLSCFLIWGWCAKHKKNRETKQFQRFLFCIDGFLTTLMSYVNKCKEI